MYKEAEIKDKKITIIGAARSGLAAAKMLKKLGAYVFISDMGSKEKLKGFIAEVENEGIDYETGGHSEKALDNDFVVISPGVPSNAAIILKMINEGKKIFSEVEVASWYNKSELIAITGSNGKTTTTSLIYDIFKRSHAKVFCAGNIGDAFSNYALGSNKNGVAVLEISSFQLDHIESFHPRVSIICNITPDHMDRYGTFDKYVSSKSRIFMNQNMNDYLVYNFDDKVVRGLVEKASTNLLPFSIKEQLDKGGFIKNEEIIIRTGNEEEIIININEIRIPGKHNLYNSLASILAAKAMKINSNIVVDGLKNFEGVEHRLEFVRELNGIKYFNDSKATNVDSVWYALDSFKVHVTLIAGGRDKGNDYSSILPLIREKVNTVVLIGEAAPKMRYAFEGLTELKDASSMYDAVIIASESAKPGEVVVLSPACASFDMFENYEHRGKIFKEIVLGL